jgi:hypothetical protein
MDYVPRQRPVSVSCTGPADLLRRPDNIAYMTMFFDSSLIAHVHVHWRSPVKVRRTLLGGSRCIIMFADLRTGLVLATSRPRPQAECMEASHAGG